MTSKKKQLGFTLIELLTAASVFSILLVIISAVFVKLLTISKRDFAIQKVHENSLFILESMAKEIRVSKIKTAPGCSSSLSIVHPTNGCIDYSLDSGKVTKSVKPLLCTDPAATVVLSSFDISFSKLNFCVKGSPTNPINPEQTRVTIITTVTSNEETGLQPTYLQTTVSSRDISE
ncbi:MAG: hypothetical protein A2750_04105 [Candidatus Yanofskybacteria bacterium RIFCSPHIGHO2_01_FULL_45_42]|uniref:Prepilin-type N-terminal cleavage/methylation domain-containing protein n=3 Tax=Candidatus Yanofskyibacteriota TaxID=1752733 RepID=A0A1F8EZ17_9BACT|nr:MAG: hypothetical protein A2750_04105 [Candidatus Yanofskybacteria bacterium RIFCSPHIGHO2_01_FULL_45_42]OGN15407.1 MAG: hypothetical protein A3C81_01580 [Candidatus Yanofskybacteria bacterium RIFCSPHIGHO2_02_FULL_46_19]OGN28246.1 MAG: hypothetical protein A3B17_02045 [Candidatus Yanofskybacteria bacterium RIFCSPLOWO2_01_FULL_45_72]OGN32455.1 MAG: hypothetical protein A3J01_00090 [Candidatus Yanofskybacteria bacterium RIFCSPLOWO2_02_FULL_45_18]